MIIYDNAPNLILNSRFEIAQRSAGAVTLTSTPTYVGVDRWASWFSNTMSGTPTSNRNGVPSGGPSYSNAGNLFTSTPTNALSSVNTRQRIESIRFSLSPENKYSLSFWAHVTNYQNCEITVSQPTVADNYTSKTTISTTNIATTLGGWKKFAVEGIVLPNQSLGVELQVVFNQPQTLSIASPVYFTEVTFSPGAKVTVNKCLPFDQELQLCMRYYEKTYNYETVFGTIQLNGAIGWNGVGSSNRPATTYFYRVEKAVTPTVTFCNPSTGSNINNQIRDTNGSVNYDINVGVTSRKSITFNPVGTPPLTAVLYTHLVADAEI